MAQKQVADDQKIRSPPIEIEGLRQIRPAVPHVDLADVHIPRNVGQSRGADQIHNPIVVDVPGAHGRAQRAAQRLHAAVRDGLLPEHEQVRFRGSEVDQWRQILPLPVEHVDPAGLTRPRRRGRVRRA